MSLVLNSLLNKMVTLNVDKPCIPDTKNIISFQFKNGVSSTHKAVHRAQCTLQYPICMHLSYEEIVQKLLYLHKWVKIHS